MANEAHLIPTLMGSTVGVSLPRAVLLAPRGSFFLGASSLRQLLLCVAPHLHERIDEIVDRLMPFCLAPHPYQRVEKVIDGFGFFGHT
jgi:hypothetical protein